MNLNKVVIIGNVTQNPEIRQTPTGQSVASFSVATNRFWKDNQGQKQTQAEFHNIVAWGRLAEIAGQYMTKGGLVMIEGRLQTKNWVDQQGVKHWKTEIIAENVQLGPRREGGGFNKPADSYDQVPPVAPSAPVAETDDDIKVEDIPF